MMEVVIDARARDHDFHSVTPMFDFGRGRERRCNPVFLGRACVYAFQQNAFKLPIESTA